MPWDRELQRLEDALRNLNAQYDSFLYGSSPKPPVEVRRRIGLEIRRLSNTEAESPAERYRFSTLQGRYNAFCERWDRLQSEKEAGRRPGIHGHFIRLGSGAAENPPVRANDRAPVSVREKDTRPGPDRERDLFERYIEARKARGEDVTSLEFPRFAERLAREREKLKSQFGAAEIEFDVAERDGRIRLIARPKG
ncbi:MAG TPA: MXAN_5187 C-terminal domain-containing protein [Thermoanaerobaculia bacterium]|nr:MXAN_5187 C-terminal domain-containing protein [Thermoanaerobaculia bacterium]